MSLITLPIDDYLSNIVSSLKQKSSLILRASPGAGKTTRVPPALLDVVQGEILVLEPRRLAARLSAERVAHERGEQCGETIGFQVRFERKISSKTRVKFITEGLFLRQLLTNPGLHGVGCVILDEFHERHIHTDVALALVKHLQNTLRPDLKLVVMSATLDSDTLAKYLPDAEIFDCEGRVFPVDVEYLLDKDIKAFPFMLEDAVNSLLKDSRCPGHILCFFPGAAEIRKASETLSGIASKNNADIFELRADLPFQEQERIFTSSIRRKIILSTNVAETSLTIEGITGVVDSGLAKISGHAAWSGMPTLDIKKISQASSIQRAGRAGRTSPGVAKRLYTQQDFYSRPSFEKPEIQRIDITQIILELETALKKISPEKNLSFRELPWFEAASEALVESCSETLRILGAIDEAGCVTSLGERMAMLPLHPRLSRVILEGKKRGCAGAAVLGTALINEGMIFKRLQQAPDYAVSDVIYQMNALIEAKLNKPSEFSSKRALIDVGQMKRVVNLTQQLAGLVQIPFEKCFESIDEDKLSTCLFFGYPDRVAALRKGNKTSHSGPKSNLTLCGGGGAVLAASSVVQNNEFLIAIDAEESQGNAAFATQVRVASGIEKEMLLEGPGKYLRDVEEFFWDANALRARGARRTYYGNLVIDETPIQLGAEKFEEVLQKALKENWPQPFEDGDALEFLKTRFALLTSSGIELRTPDFSDRDEFEFLLANICENKKSFAEVCEKTLSEYLLEVLDEDTRNKLQRFAPDRITIGAGRKVRVHYESDKPPWVASRLQDFFGTLKTPAILNGKLNLVVQLLAPNSQVVQVTTDLEGFWERNYDAVKKELSRKYPRHHWPDDPKIAEPPEHYVKRRKP